MAPSDHDATGTLIAGRYRLEEELGRGAMGVVYRAFDQTLQREVAVKLVAPAALGTDGRARLLREARAAAALNHPNICTVYEVQEADDASFIAMEMVEGETLHDLLARDGPLPFGRLLDIALTSRQKVPMCGGTGRARTASGSVTPTCSVKIGIIRFTSVVLPAKQLRSNIIPTPSWTSYSMSPMVKREPSGSPAPLVASEIATSRSAPMHL